jgi:hypothetical protein
MNNKLLSKSRVMPTKKVGIDTVAEFRKRDRNGLQLLYRASQVYAAGQEWRDRRARYKRYYFNDQWSDIVVVDGKPMTEEEYITKQGLVPLQNNLVRRLGRNVIGVYRSQAKEPVCVARDRDEQHLGETMSTVLQYNWQINRMKELNARSLEEFLIGGMPIQHKSFGWRQTMAGPGRYDCWTDMVEPDRFIVDASMSDFRTWDCSMVGQIHDMTFNHLASRFCKRPGDFAKLREMYSTAVDLEALTTTLNDFGIPHLSDYSFFIPNESNKCRVIELWTKETKQRYRCVDYLNGDNFKVDPEDLQRLVLDVNAEREQQAIEAGMDINDVPMIEFEWFVDEYWYYRFLTPLGDILQEGETPYDHGSHPFVFLPYPFIDGEIHPFVGDFIDQQRYVNRLIILYDFLMKSSAKGALLVPEEALGDHSPEEFAENWAKVGSVIVYSAKKGAKPEQLATNVTNIGITDLLNLQLKFFEDISGVQGALQGKPGYSSTSGALYAQQAQNATTSLLDLLEAYSGFVLEGAAKDVSNIQQFYNSKRVFNIAGKSEEVEYDPEKMAVPEFDLSIVESTSTPAYRDWANEWLMRLFERNAIGVKQLLESGDFPFSDKLLQSIQSEEQLQQDQVDQMQQQIQRDPAKMQQLQQLIQGSGAPQPSQQVPTPLVENPYVS